MYRYVLEDRRHVPPFNEPASQLTIGTTPLKLHHENLILNHYGANIKLGPTLLSREDLSLVKGEAIVYRDSLWFDKEFFEYFIERAQAAGKACRAAFSASDKAFHTYTVPLTKGFELALDPETQGVLFLCDLWYFPNGYTSEIQPILIPSEAREIGFYSVPDFMTMKQGDLTHYAPKRAVISVESWVHVYFASIIFGNFGRAGRLDNLIEQSVFAKLKMLWRAVLEQKQILSSSAAVKIGKHCNIDPSAVITGPGSIGDNVSIGAGAIIDNCTIGDNVTIDAGCVLMMSSVGNNCFLPFRSALYLTALMENTIIAQNTCLQMCVIGRNSFVGAGSTFTDFNLIAQKPIRAANIDGELQSVGQIVLGSAVGHNCRIGSGMVVFPGRMIESDVVLVASPGRRVITRNVSFEESDHHYIKFGEVHKRFYPRPDEVMEEVHDSWDSW
jgi:UDP-N-acetylglucosamine diphosphorylase / glucose-1-phosphate thymidylyltransferase / UDP-N-acetylgalactosamine diphosphorylase / glucosamine-1-phosphate N-acetyltransferase / galactosamine-1-phosphate N-acetyltransferase